MKKIFFLLFVMLIYQSIQANEKIGNHLKNYLQFAKPDEPVKVWIYFTDKGTNQSRFYANPELIISKESIERRKKVLPSNQLIDFDDLPINQEYIDIVKTKVLEIKTQIQMA